MLPARRLAALVFITVGTSVLTFGAANATSNLGSVIASWDARYPWGSGYVYPQGLTYGDGYIWVDNVQVITKRLPSNGSVVSTIPIVNYWGYDMGYESDTGYLYCALGLHGGHGVCVRNSSSGSIVRTFAPPPGATNIRGADFHNGSPSNPVWLSDPGVQRIWNLTSTGSVVNTLTTTFNTVYGLAYDGDTAGGPFLFAGTATWTPIIYAVDPTNGSVLYSFEAPFGHKGLKSLSWDGSYLWGVDNDFASQTSGVVRQFIAHDNNPTVAPASLGKIKALYR